MDFLKSIDIFSEKIKKLISEDEWTELNDVLRQRQLFLEKFFYQIPPTELSIEIIKVVKSIQLDDKIFIDTLDFRKEELKKQYLALKQGRKSVQAYRP